MLSRREFLKHCRNLSIAIAGTEIFAHDIAHGFMSLSAEQKPKVVFIQSQCCTGCSVSATYGNEIDFIDFITNVIRLQVHPNLSFSQGEDYMRVLEETVSEGGFYLVLEGSIPMGIKEACMFGDEPIADYLKHVIPKAAAIVASGTCAAYGGIPASNQNVTGAIPVDEYMKREGLKKPLIKIPGCPISPDRLMGTVAYIVATGKLPELVDGKPKQYFGELLHDHCGRYQAFNQDKYLENYAAQKTECLLKVGCRGPVTKTDCATRRWNGKISVCVESNSPCIGCIHPNFPFRTQMYLSAKQFQDASWNQMKDFFNK